MDTFEQAIEKERTRLGMLREDLLSQQASIATQLAEIANELNAISAYEKAKAGTAPRTSRAAKDARSPRGSKRDGVLALVRTTPDLTRGEIIDRLGVKGSRGEEQSVSNALATLKKAGTLTAEDGKYRVVPGA